jgi:hypothetical protein
MDDKEIIQKAIEEIQTKTFGVTQQFLAIHEVDLANVDKLRIDREMQDGTVIVYFPVKREMFEPNPEPDEFEDKLRSLLVFLQQDIEGVKLLVEKAGGYIQVAMEFHNGNTMLGGPHISPDLVKQMSLLNLGVDFDLYVGGNSFKE